MTTADAAIGPLPEAYHRAQLRRAAIASTVGTTIEWYDFLLYGQVASIVFAKLFFPKSEPLVGTLEAFGIYFVGFVARPIGAAIFGHYGDRIGRKAALIATLLLTGLSTFAVGLVPTYNQIGIWAAAILVVLRLIQGIGVGGEWGGSVLLAMEWARTNKHRGFIASLPQFGGPAGLFLANLAVLAFSAISGDEFITWGWRVPFYLSLVMVAVGLWIRLGILETPVFSQLVEANRLEQVPVLEVIKRQPKAVILTALARSVELGPAYIYFSFVFVYGSLVLHVSRELLLSALLLAASIYPAYRPHLGPLRPQAHVYHRRRGGRSLRFSLLRADEHRAAEPDRAGDSTRVCVSRLCLRAARGVDRGMLHGGLAFSQRARSAGQGDPPSVSRVAGY